jgi:hypothetical protein
MKKNLLIFITLISMISIINVSQANANCSPGDPCGTWAMLDSQGVVTNVIVCQASVCGSGTWAGQTVVPQVAPNPITNTPDGTGSYIGNSNSGTQVIYSEGVFTVKENKTIVNSYVEVNNENTTISKVEIPISERTFTYQDTINKQYGEVEMTITKFNENLETKLEVTQITPTNVLNEQQNMLFSEIKESIKLNDRKNENEIIETINNNGLNLLLSRIQIFISLLGSWVK